MLPTFAPGSPSARHQLYENNWWVWVQGATGQWVGYYPSWLFFGGPGRSLFTTLGAVAEWVGFWGEVYSALSDPNQTTDQMGSGRLAEMGFSYACFERNLLILEGGNWVNHKGSASAKDPSRYDIQLQMNSDGPWGSYFYAGGPEAALDAAAGAGIAASQQVGLNQTDAFVVNKNGSLNVFWVVDAGDWFHVPLGPAGVFPPGAPLAASQQFGLGQTDVFVVDKNGTAQCDVGSRRGSLGGASPDRTARDVSAGSADRCFATVRTESN
jgi:hypothetical protein